MHKRNMFLLVISRVVTCLIALTMLSGSTVSVFAAGQKERTNETTGYKAVIADEAELLKDFLTDTKGFFRRLCPVEKPGFQDW